MSDDLREHFRFYERKNLERYIQDKLNKARFSKEGKLIRPGGIKVPFYESASLLTQIILEFSGNSWKIKKDFSELGLSEISPQEALYLVTLQEYQNWISEHRNHDQFLCANLSVVLLLEPFIMNLERVGFLKDGTSNFHLDRQLLFGLAFYESGGRTNFTSKAGARGFFQILEKTARELIKDSDKIPDELIKSLGLTREKLSISNLEDFRVNLLFSGLYFRNLYLKYPQTKNSISLSTIAYYAGPGTVEKILSEVNQDGENSREAEGFIKNNYNIVDALNAIDSKSIRKYFPRVLSSSLIYNINIYLTELIQEAVEKQKVDLYQIREMFGISESIINRAKSYFKDIFDYFERYFPSLKVKRSEFEKKAIYAFHALAIQIVLADEFIQVCKYNPLIIHLMFERPKEYAKLMGLIKHLNDRNRNYEVEQFAEMIKRKKRYPSYFMMVVPNKSEVENNNRKDKQSETKQNEKSKNKNENKSSTPIVAHAVLKSSDGIPLTYYYDYGEFHARFKFNMTNPISPLKDKSDQIATDGIINAKPFFGAKRGINRKHKGLDIYAPIGTNVRAAQDGIVIYVQEEDMYGKDPKSYQDNPYLNGKGKVNFVPYGKFVIIKHAMKAPPGYYYTTYAHLKDVKVKKGQIVKRGDIIGTVGLSGNARNAQNPVENSHVHFDLRIPRPVRDKKNNRYKIIPPYDGENCKAVNPLVVN